jgi:hypothetical protein
MNERADPLFVAGVVLLHSAWGATATALAYTRVPEWIGPVGALALLAIHTIPWARFARRRPGTHPRLDTALHAAVAYACIGAIGTILLPLFEGAARPAPGEGLNFSIEPLALWMHEYSYGELAGGIALYTAVSTAWAVGAAMVALRVAGRIEPADPRRAPRFGGRAPAGG